MMSSVPGFVSQGHSVNVSIVDGWLSPPLQNIIIIDRSRFKTVACSRCKGRSHADARARVQLYSILLPMALRLLLELVSQRSLELAIIMPSVLRPLGVWSELETNLLFVAGGTSKRLRLRRWRFPPKSDPRGAPRFVWR